MLLVAGLQVGVEIIEKSNQINDRRSEILHMSEGQLVYKCLDLHVVGSTVAADVWVSQ